MKTIEQLIEDLGQWFDICGNWHEFYIFREDNFVEIRDEKKRLYLSLYKNGEYKLHVSIMDMPFVYVRSIVEYVSSTNENDWFTEGKAEVKDEDIK